MAVFRGSKDQLMAEVAALTVKVEMLGERLAEKKEEIQALNASLRRTQDALIAKEAPAAYEDHRAAEYAAEEPTEEQKKWHDRQRQLAEMNGELLKLTEQPLFRNAEDMIDMLTPSPETPVLKSLHGDGES